MGVESGPLYEVHDAHTGPIYALAFNNYGVVATGAKDREIGIWNMSATTSQRLSLSRRLVGHTAGITALGFYEANNEALLLSGSADNTTRIWDMATWTTRGVIDHPKTVFHIAVRPDKELEFATACWDGIARIFSLPGGVQSGALQGHEAGLYSVSYSPVDTSLLATASADRTLRIWDLNTMKPLMKLMHKDHVTTVDWSPVQPWTLASGGWDRLFRIWELPEQTMKRCRMSSEDCSEVVAPRTTAKHPNLIWRTAFAPGGEHVAVCHGAVGQSPSVYVYDVASGLLLRRLVRHKDTPLAIVWSRDGSLLASTGMDRKVLVYDGYSMSNDLPRGDRDDIAERQQWKQDLRDMHKNLTNLSSSNTTTNQSGGFLPPHPLSGPRMAFM